jgi:hypothetical protein
MCYLRLGVYAALQRIALILVWVTSVHLLTQVLYKKTVDAVTPSTGPITMKSAVGERANATVVTRVATSAGAGLLASALPLTPSGLSLGQQSSWCLAAYTKTHRTIAMGGSAVEDGSVLKLERRVNTSVAVAESGLVSLPQRTQGHTFGALRRNEPRVAVLRETLEGTAVGPGLAQEYADEDYSAS